MKPILIDLPVPILTPRLLIRPPQIGDGVVLNEAVIESFATLSQFMDWAKEKPSVNDSEEQVRLGTANWILKKSEEPWLPLLIFSRKNNQLVGATGFHHIVWEVPCAETGYWVRTSCERLGYMTEAINAITQYAFKQMKVNRLGITCDVNNNRSQKLAERLGFVLEGKLKANRVEPLTAKITDTLVYARYELTGLPDLVVSWGHSVDNVQVGHS